MKPRILIVYYTQTGQLRQILDSIVSEISNDAEIDFCPIEPVTPFPFPWTALQFFDAMPETVEHLPGPVKAIPADTLSKKYDLVILGYQPWFLNPSQPVTAFLKSSYASVFKDCQVITVVGCRNMWLHAQERVKAYLQNAGARLAGNIVLNDTNPNLVSLLTVIRWAFKGQKAASGMLPAAGVQEKDIKGAARFGNVILDHIKGGNSGTLQQGLLDIGAIDLKPGLVVLEQRGIKNFRKWAKFIREKGGPGDPNRARRVMLFKNLLLVAIFILSPVSSLTAYIQLQLKKSALMRDVEYFKGVQYEKGRL